MESLIKMLVNKVSNQCSQINLWVKANSVESFHFLLLRAQLLENKALGLFTTVLGLNTSPLPTEMFAGCSACSPISPGIKFSQLQTMSGWQGKDFGVRKTCPHVQYLLLPNCVIVDRLFVL